MGYWSITIVMITMITTTTMMMVVVVAVMMVMMVVVICQTDLPDPFVAVHRGRKARVLKPQYSKPSSCLLS